MPPETATSAPANLDSTNNQSQANTPAAPATPPADIVDVLRGPTADRLFNAKTKKKDKPVAADPAKPDKKDEPIGSVKSATPEPAKAATTPAAEPAKPSAEPQPEPALKVRKSQPRSTGLSAEDAARIAAETAARYQQSNTPAAPAAPSFELPEHMKQKADIYAELERLNPTKYKDITRKQAEFGQKEFEHAVQWEEDEKRRQIAAGTFDPAKPPLYDANDPQHAKFYERYQPEIDPSDEEEARFEIKFNKRFKERVEPKIGQYEKTITRMEAEPVAQQSVGHFDGTMLSVLNPGVELNKDTVNKWAEENPIEAEIAAEINQIERPTVHAASMLWDGAVEFDQKNQAHVDAAQKFNQYEAELSALENQPIDNQGRPWIPYAQFNEMVKKSPREAAKYCTTTKAHLVNYIALEAASRVKAEAKKQRELVEKRAAKLGYVKGQPSNPTGSTPATEPAKPSPALASPSVSGSSPTPPSTGTAPAPRSGQRSPMDRLLTIR